MTTETITPTHAAFCMPAGERRDFVFRCAREEFERRYGPRIEANVARYDRVAQAFDAELARIPDDITGRARLAAREGMRAMQLMGQAFEYLQKLWDKCFELARLRLIAASGQDILDMEKAVQESWRPENVAKEPAEESPTVKALRLQLLATQPIGPDGKHHMPPPPPLSSPLPAPAPRATPARQGPLSGKQMKELYNRYYRHQLDYRDWVKLKRRAVAEGMNAAQITEMVEAQIQAREAGSVVA